MRKLDLTTRKIGHLTVIRPTDQRERGAVIWECLCDCGRTVHLSTGHLSRKRPVKSCGDLIHAPRLDLTNQKYGTLTPIKIVGRDRVGRILWLCECDCGDIYIGRAGRISAREINSCGCQEGKYIHGLGESKGYRVHYAMLQRCYNPKCKNYKNYGARGINVCERWLDVISFIADMGQPPKGLTIERVNNDVGYWCGHCSDCLAKDQPANCRWDTMTNQNRNHRSNRHLTAFGKTQTFTEWAVEFNLAKSTLGNRLQRGWKIERALTQPTR